MHCLARSHQHRDLNTPKHFLFVELLDPRPLRDFPEGGLNFEISIPQSLSRSGETVHGGPSLEEVDQAIWAICAIRCPLGRPPAKSPSTTSCLSTSHLRRPPTGCVTSSARSRANSRAQEQEVSIGDAGRIGDERRCRDCKGAQEMARLLRWFRAASPAIQAVTRGRGDYWSERRC